MVKVYEHDHPLKLIDLQVNVEDAEDSEEDEEEKDMVIQQEFVCPCKRCDQPIHEYYRYYYKCVDDSCDYSAHKVCAELPTTLKYPSYSDDHFRLTHECYRYYRYPMGWDCDICGKRIHDLFYECKLDDDYRLWMCVRCAVKQPIYHPCHPHPLVSLISKPILCYCNACGKKHEGIFFLCTTCSEFAIHTDCAFLPKRLLIQQSTNDIFHHAHPLTLSYSFPVKEMRDKYRPKCRVCNHNFKYIEANIWIYKCEKCIYYVHAYCATLTSREEPFMRILSSRGQLVKNYEDADYPHLFHLPFPDETYNIPKQLFFKELIQPTKEISLQHSSSHHHHHHELILVNTKYDGVCHNPMKKIEVLCNVCVRPITEIPFYKCEDNEDDGCNFALHEWCTRLPTQVDKQHPGHPQHTLLLKRNVPTFLNGFYCGVCRLPCNGYAYGCDECDYYVDVTCAFTPEKITHKSHPNHLLSLVDEEEIDDMEKKCIMCLKHFGGFKLGFSCSVCDVYIHPGCALLLSETIRHRFDKHPMYLSYLPIENHKSEYFCEICEEKMNPHQCFYHCDECAQSVHSACAPAMCCENATLAYEDHTNIYGFINIKFGSIHKIYDHQHPLSFAIGIDGRCSECSESLENEAIFKCLKCKYAIDIRCYKKKNKNNS